MEAKDIKNLFENGTRDFRRIKLQHRAYFILKEGNRGWEECTLLNTNKNLKGIGIRFHTDKEIKVNSVVTIDLSANDECRPACITGIIRWIQKVGNGFVGGVELTDSTEKLKRILP